MDKVVASPAEAVADIPNGASVAVSGFGLSSGVPFSLLAALRQHGARDLCLVGNTVGGAVARVIENDQVSRLIVSFVARPNIPSPAGEYVRAGRITYEIVPQGTLVERMRAAGAGLAGVYTPTGVGTPIAQNKEVRFFDGKPFLFEPAIHVDYALITAYRADRIGNCEFRGSSEHFNPCFAKAARVAIVEAEEIVEPGEIDPHHVGLAGPFVTRVVQRTLEPERAAVTTYRRPADASRSYNGKVAWTRSQMAEQAALLLPEGSYVNLGLGIPTLVAQYLEGRDVTLHGENGILGYGPPPPLDEVDYYVHDAGSSYVSVRPGAAYFDSVTAFEMVRSGKLDVVVLGAYQVDEAANFANWSTPEVVGGGIGGAMDMVVGGATVIVLMEHRDSRDRPKLVRSCTYPLTGAGCVDLVVTDLSVLRRRDGEFQIDTVAPGFTKEEIAALSEMHLAC